MEIEEKLNDIDALQVNKIETKDLLSKQEIETFNDNYILKTDLIIDENLYLAENKNLDIKEGVKIFF